MGGFFSKGLGFGKRIQIFLLNMDRAAGFDIIGRIGLFSVPAPPTRDLCVRRGFLL